jgi:hypothetical protein
MSGIRFGIDKPSNGRPRGTLNRTTLEVRNAARALVEDPVYRVSLLARLLEGTAPHMETLLWHYAYGKPTKDTNEVAAESVVAFQNMTKAERAELAEALARQARAAADEEAGRQISDGGVVDAEVVK